MKAANGVVLALVLAGVILSAPLGQAAPHRTTIKKNYTGGGGTTHADYPNVFTQDQYGSESVGGALAYTETGENRVSIVAKDATGLLVPMRVFLVRKGKIVGEPLLFCDGKTDGRLAIKPGSGVQIFMVTGMCEGAAGVPTRGEIMFNFTTAR